MASQYDYMTNKRVRFSGDVCNAPREGTITNIEIDRWGHHAVIEWDDPNAIGWDSHGNPVEFLSETTRLSAHLIGRDNKDRYRLI